MRIFPIFILLFFLGTDFFAYDWRDDLPIRERRKKAPRTYVFSQAQLMYGLAPYGSYYQWNDRPLLINPALRPEKATGPYKHDPQFPDFVQMAKNIAGYDMDGFGFFPDNYPRRDYAGKLLEYTERCQVPDFSLLPLLSRNTGIAENIKRISNSSAVFEVNGKKLVGLKYETAKNPELEKILNSIRQEYGDRFIFLREVSADCGRGIWQFKYREGKISREDIQAVKEHYRKYLRSADGIIADGLWALTLDHGYRIQYTEYYRDFLLRVIRSVISEPEFADKYLMLTARVAHENTYRLGYSIGGNGTKTLRTGSMEPALEADPDFILQLEWDEENENTSMRPTVCRSFTFQRIMRYYMAQLQNKLPAPVPGDNSETPNLVLSIRKIVSLGERIGIELLNIPDSIEIFSYSVKVTLKNHSGQVVHEFPEIMFDASRMYDQTFYLPSEKFNRELALIPSLEIHYKGQVRTYEDGLPCVMIQPPGNTDYMWLNQPLRDLLKAEVEFNHDKHKFSAAIKSEEPLNYAEVLDNDHCVYSYSKNIVKSRENPEYIVIQAMINSVAPAVLNGSITVKNATSENRIVDRMWRSPAPGNLVFKNFGTWIYNSPTFIRIDRQSAAGAVLKVEINGLNTEILVRDILEKQIVGLNNGQISLTFSRSLQQWEHLAHIGEKEIGFTVELVPEMKHSGIQLLLIGQSGKTWRSRPLFCIGQDNTDRMMTVYSETLEKVLEVPVASNRIPDLKYDFSDSHGTVLTCPQGRLYWGIGGGFTEQSTLRGIGYGNQLAREKNYCKTKPAVTAPEFIHEPDGGYSLRFNGTGSHIALPAQTLPRRSGYDIAFEIQPEKLEGWQCLLTTRLGGRGPSSLEIYLEDGVLKSLYVTDRTEVYATDRSFQVDSKLRLATDKWSKVVIHYDLENITFEVNGKKSEAFYCPGPGRFDTGIIIGGWEKAWFQGKIKNLIIRHAK